MSITEKKLLIELRECMRDRGVLQAQLDEAHKVLGYPPEPKRCERCNKTDPHKLYYCFHCIAEGEDIAQKLRRRLDQAHDEIVQLRDELHICLAVCTNALQMLADGEGGVKFQIKEENHEKSDAGTGDE